MVLTTFKPWLQKEFALKNNYVIAKSKMYSWILYIKWNGDLNLHIFSPLPIIWSPYEMTCIVDFSTWCVF
jgi:hypothetical protein